VFGFDYKHKPEAWHHSLKLPGSLAAAETSQRPVESAATLLDGPLAAPENLAFAGIGREGTSVQQQNL
jgi:hypothetical protein